MRGGVYRPGDRIVLLSGVSPHIEAAVRTTRRKSPDPPEIEYVGVPA